MQSTVRKIGNSTGVILPAIVLKTLKLKQGDSVNIETDNGKIVIEKDKPRYTLEQLIAKCDPDAPPVTHDWDNLKPAGSEVW